MNRGRAATLRQNLMALPQHSIARLPTPLDEVPRFSAAIGQVRVLIKREDMTGSWADRPYSDWTRQAGRDRGVRNAPSMSIAGAWRRRGITLRHHDREPRGEGGTALLERDVRVSSRVRRSRNCSASLACERIQSDAPTVGTSIGWISTSLNGLRRSARSWMSVAG